MDIFHTRLPDKAPKFRALSSPVLQSCIAAPQSQPRRFGRLMWVRRRVACPAALLGQLSGALRAPGQMPRLLLWALCSWQALVFSFSPAP